MTTSITIRHLADQNLLPLLQVGADTQAEAYRLVCHQDPEVLAVSTQILSMQDIQQLVWPAYQELARSFVPCRVGDRYLPTGSNLTVHDLQHLVGRHVVLWFNFHAFAVHHQFRPYAIGTLKVAQGTPGGDTLIFENVLAKTDDLLSGRSTHEVMNLAATVYTLLLDTARFHPVQYCLEISDPVENGQIQMNGDEWRYIPRPRAYARIYWHEFRNSVQQRALELFHDRPTDNTEYTYAPLTIERYDHSSPEIQQLILQLIERDPEQFTAEELRKRVLRTLVDPNTSILLVGTDNLELTAGAVLCRKRPDRYWELTNFQYDPAAVQYLTDCGDSWEALIRVHRQVVADLCVEFGASTEPQAPIGMLCAARSPIAERALRTCCWMRPCDAHYHNSVGQLKHQYARALLDLN